MEHSELNEAVELTKAAEKMDVAVFGELAVWFKQNVFDETKSSPELELTATADESAEDVPADRLSDSARLYQWCPRRKRLVQSN